MTEHERLNNAFDMILPDKKLLNSESFKKHMNYALNNPDIDWLHIVYILRKQSESKLCKTKDNWLVSLKENELIGDEISVLDYQEDKTIKMVGYHWDQKNNDIEYYYEDGVFIPDMALENIERKRIDELIDSHNSLRSTFEMVGESTFKTLSFYYASTEEEWIRYFSKSFIQAFVSKDTLDAHEDFLCGCIEYCILYSLDAEKLFNLPVYEYKKNSMMSVTMYILIIELIHLIPDFFMYTLGNAYKTTSELKEAEELQGILSKSFNDRKTKAIKKRGKN